MASHTVVGWGRLSKFNVRAGCGRLPLPLTFVIPHLRRSIQCSLRAWRGACVRSVDGYHRTAHGFLPLRVVGYRAAGGLPPTTHCSLEPDFPFAPTAGPHCHVQVGQLPIRVQFASRFSAVSAHGLEFEAQPLVGQLSAVVGQSIAAVTLHATPTSPTSTLADAAAFATFTVLATLPSATLASSGKGPMGGGEEPGLELLISQRQHHRRHGSWGCLHSTTKHLLP
mmetsp:Transcript_42008/g.94924  ORF Transcript_42008/g.94924 Transcript_42008/m.94924 type:complete len:225 (-) Transcript_42008:628-1302(-)